VDSLQHVGTQAQALQLTLNHSCFLLTSKQNIQLLILSPMLSGVGQVGALYSEMAITFVFLTTQILTVQVMFAMAMNTISQPVLMAITPYSLMVTLTFKQLRSKYTLLSELVKQLTLWFTIHGYILRFSSFLIGLHSPRSLLQPSLGYYEFPL
jgi:hypothetical protein